ncbi:helix-turn-helix domain-containing protein [Thermogemmatispora tikiterensis]|uniref:HTH cro/C1-type domain-containing protein n=1 Tax=Thermogemmatispora tikiterensis TaxID=1825093 RepID=A0A328VH23_9CHLR|nr:helix-turn-helix transcriptional regulator [Thermogemmatispora tikiterensis]RAQ96299.1 hypothetical protein A4R35_12205 [Thermogemmatispora tikiterensis]
MSYTDSTIFAYEGRIVLRLRIKEIAREKGISMNQLSQRAEVSYNIIKAIYRNPYRPTNTETVNRIAHALGVPTTVLLEDVSEEEMVREQRALAAELAVLPRRPGRQSRHPAP